MPITKIDLTGSRKFFEQTCACCGYKQRIAFGHGAHTTKEAPFMLKDGATLDVQVDGGATQQVTFTSGSFANIAAATAAELMTVLGSALTGATAYLDASPDCVTIESSTPGEQSSIVIVGGTALKALGLTVVGPDEAAGRPAIGRVACGLRLPDQFILRHCNGCGVNDAIRTTEVLSRTWDTAPDLPEYKHRRAVNALFEWMKANGHVHPDLILDYAAEDQVPPDMLPDIDKAVIEIPMP